MENDNSKKLTRRAFLGGLGALGCALVGKAQEARETISLPLAPPAEYKPPYPRKSPITPPGSHSHSNFRSHCTGCQLCVSACPNKVLNCTSNPLLSTVQPSMTFERGYCRPGCHTCSKTCPTGAITFLPGGAKSTIQIGHAVYDMNACVVLTDGVNCGLCARRCTTGAIALVDYALGPRQVKVPAVDESRCIGCGACEHYCPAKPISAIHVEGHQVHRDI